MKQAVTPSSQASFRKMNRVAGVYNMIPNFLWTALFVLPVSIYCYRFINSKTIFMLLGICLIGFFLPNIFFDKIQLSRQAGFYRKLGIKYINAFAQNGALVNKILRKKYPQFKVVTNSRPSIKKQYYQTYFFEKFHFSLFLFFALITADAVIEYRFYWGFILVVCNLLYNVYPNLLQQYIRVKLKSSLVKRADP